jgi:hypothetical protein
LLKGKSSISDRGIIAQAKSSGAKLGKTPEKYILLKEL